MKVLEINVVGNFLLTRGILNKLNIVFLPEKYEIIRKILYGSKQEEKSEQKNERLRSKLKQPYYLSVSEKQLKEYVGHTPLQAAVGALVGVIVAISLIAILY